jgi:DNA ligase-1
MSKKYPTLYHKSSQGKILVWNIETKKDGDKAQRISLAGQQDGKKVQSITNITKGKNVGRSNETTPLEQACSEALSKWKDKKKKGYVEDIADLDKKNPHIKPILAQKYPAMKKKVKYPCYVQRKYNGVRNLVTVNSDGIFFFSRRGTDYDLLPHIKAEISTLVGNKTNIMLDGEIYVHGIPLEHIAGCMNRKRGKKLTGHAIAIKDKLEYHVYDCYDIDNPNLGFEDRHKILNEMNWDVNSIIQADTFRADTEEEMEAKYQEFIQGNYEGLMIRNANGIYVPNKRSQDLLKYKDFSDAEFKIIGFKDGVGISKGCVIWKCVTDEGNEFDVTPSGTHDSRKEIFKNGDSYIGKMLTVRYPELTTKGIPRHGVGIVIRDYE